MKNLPKMALGLSMFLAFQFAPIVSQAEGCVITCPEATYACRGNTCTVWQAERSDGTIFKAIRCGINGDTASCDAEE